MYERTDHLKDRYMRAQGALLGLAIGDTVTHSSMQRSRFAAPLWMERILDRISAHDRTYNIDRFVVPFIMNQDPKLLLMKPSSRTEWAIFTAQCLLQSKDELSPEVLGEYWIDNLVSQSEKVRSGLAERSAIMNLSKGLKPPMCGMDNPHFYDDGAISRAVSIGIRFSPDPPKAARNAEVDAMVSHDKDGVWGAMAMASAIAYLVAGVGRDEAIERSVRYFPEGSWIKYQWEVACQLDVQKEPFDLLLEMDTKLVDKTYSYSNLAPQTLPIAFVLFKQIKGDIAQGIALANCLPRVSDSVVPFVGALLGAEQGIASVSEGWITRLGAISGTFVPQAAGSDLTQLATQLMDLAQGRGDDIENHLDQT